METKESPNYRSIVEDMLENSGSFSHFAPNLFSEKKCERFHQDVKKIERRYQEGGISEW